MFDTDAPAPSWLCRVCGHLNNDHVAASVLAPVGDEMVEVFPCDVSGCQCMNYEEGGE